MAATNAILAWTLVSECPIPGDVNDLMVTGEEAVAAYRTIRDSAIFTNKRLIIRDAQGLSGKKIEIYLLPYSSINMWSTENAGTFDLNAEVELWTRAGHIKVNLKKGIGKYPFYTTKIRFPTSVRCWEPYLLVISMRPRRLELPREILPPAPQEN